MSDNPIEQKVRTRSELEEELEGERALRAKIHRYLGMLATLLVLVAIVVALTRMRATTAELLPNGMSPWEAMGLGATTIPWILGILGLGVLFSMGTTRLMALLERVVNLIKGKKASG